jgi:hypothetical protein
MNDLGQHPRDAQSRAAEIAAAGHEIVDLLYSNADGGTFSGVA